jgi:ABC-2 type transport system ATP-binding protein
VSKGTTVLLTTQYLEEADQLADDIVVIDHGKEIAHGTSDELKAMIGGERIEVTVTSPADVAEAQAIMSRFASGELQVNERSRTLVAPIAGGTSVFRQALNAIHDAGLDVYDVGLRRPTLDDVFLSITGRAAEQPDQAAEVDA